MKRKLEIKKTVEINYTEYWVIRVIRDDTSKKTAVREKEFLIRPNEQDIVDELLKCNPGEFVTVEHNFRMDK